MTNVVIVGGGLVGALAGIYFCNNKDKVAIYEKRSDPRTLLTRQSRRSINLALSNRGIKALEAVGLHKEVLCNARPMHARMLHLENGKCTEDVYGECGQAIYSIDRNWLNKYLLTEAEARGVRVHFDCSLQRLDRLDSDSLCCTFIQNRRNELHGTGDLVVGADGINSRVRMELERLGEPIKSKEVKSELAYKEVEIPKGSSLSIAHLHIWPRNEHMFIALPNMDGSFTATLFHPEFAAIEANVIGYMRAHYQELFDYITEADFSKEWHSNPTSSLSQVTCSQYHDSAQRVLLIGDAAHAILPFYGQGMNAGFEDLTVLFEEIIRAERPLAEYSQRRVPDAQAITQLATNNYWEMSGGVLRVWHRMKKSVLRIAHRACPLAVTPLYSMIAFSSIPYSRALWLDRAHSVFASSVFLAIPSLALLYRLYTVWR